jgi:hypothetical protein
VGRVVAGRDRAVAHVKAIVVVKVALPFVSF